MVISFYERCRELDKLKSESNIKRPDIEKLMEFLQEDAFCRYFFWDLKNPNWLKVQELKTFISTKLSENNNERDSDWIENYLLLLASEHSKKICGIIKNSDPKNSQTISLIIKIINKIDIRDTAKLILFLKKTINSKKHFNHTEIANTVDRLTRGGFEKEGLNLFGTILEPIAEKKKKIMEHERDYEPQPRMDFYEIGKFVDKTLPSLIEKKPNEVVNILEKNLRKCFSIEQKDQTKKIREDYSWIWKPAIEEDDKHYGLSAITELFVSSLRDTMQAFPAGEKGRIREITQRYLTSNYSIFRRLALHIIRIKFIEFKGQEFVTTFLLKKKNFNDYKTKHEYFLLLKEHFSQLDSKTKNQIERWINDGPDIISYRRWAKKQIPKFNQKYEQDYIDQWKFERLWTLKKYFPERATEIVELKKRFGEPNETINTNEAVTGGWDNPIGEFGLMTDDEIIKNIKNPIPQKNEPISPFFGSALVFQAAVKDNPQKFLLLANRFANSDVYPIFIQHYFRGLEEFWKNKTNNSVNIDSWNDGIEKLAEFIMKTKGTIGSFSPKEYSIARSTLANYIEIIIINNKSESNKTHFPVYKKLLLSMIGDEHPSKQEETQYKDWIMLSINSTAGIALHTLIKYALHNINESDRGNEEIPKLEDDVKEKLSEALKDPRKSVHTVFGMYFNNLYYLDKDWVKENINTIFPEHDEELWSSAWNAYIAYCHLFNDIFILLQPQYKKAIDSLKDKDDSDKYGIHKMDTHLAEHLALAYWRGLPNAEIEKETSLFLLFYEKANIELKAHIIEYLSLGLKEQFNSKRINQNSKAWVSLRNLWKWRLCEVSKIPNDKLNNREISAFTEWLEYLPESIEEIYDLLEKTFKIYNLDLSSGRITEYLKSNCEKYSIKCVELLEILLNKNITEMYFHIDYEDVEFILEKGLEAGDEGKNIARNIANILGAKGYFYYKKIWDKSYELN